MRGFGWLKPARHGAACEAAHVAEEARRLARTTAARLDRLAAAHEDLERRVAPLLPTAGYPQERVNDTHDPQGRED
jgi:hypothetical protein